jgi:hypothetical protein
MDHGPLLLVQQRDQLLLGADRAPGPPVGVVEEADDRHLLLAWRQGHLDRSHMFEIEAVAEAVADERTQILVAAFKGICQEAVVRQTFVRFDGG